MKRYDQAGKAKWLILVIAAGILLLGVILYAGGRWLETRSVEEARGDLTQTEAVETQEYNGVTYQRREGLTSILVMGVDHDSAVESEGAYQGGQGDFQRLIVIDPERQVIRQLKIDRDTMTECTVLGYLGSPIGTKEMQISLAHGFGDGKEESCEYAREAVEGLLLGESIDFYVAMNMDGISELNDLAEKIRASEQFTADLYDALQPYLVTDMARGRIINETWNARAYTLEEPCQITGEHRVAEDGFTEFYPDADSIRQAVLELFWEPVETN